MFPQYFERTFRRSLSLSFDSFSAVSVSGQAIFVVFRGCLQASAGEKKTKMFYMFCECCRNFAGINFASSTGLQRILPEFDQVGYSRQIPAEKLTDTGPHATCYFNLPYSLPAALAVALRDFGRRGRPRGLRCIARAISVRFDASRLRFGLSMFAHRVHRELETTRTKHKKKSRN